MNNPVTVVIPTYSRSELLRLTLRGLCAPLNLSHLEEVIVVSDGHDDLAASVAHAFSDQLPIRYLEQEKSGVSAARNLGISAAKSSVVVLLDDDVVPSPNLVLVHSRFHSAASDLHSVLLGYVTWHPKLEITPFMRWYGERGALFAFGLLSDGSATDPRYFYSCNISFKREFVLANGGFNTSLTVLEDNELGYRLSQAGMRLVFSRSALGYHYQTFTFAQACKRLDRYSSGLTSFLATPAGKALAKTRRRFSFRCAEAAVLLTAPLLKSFIPILDSKRRMPNFFYRLMYWYYASYSCFWSRAKDVPSTK
jgi:glycosyltransferase involved in cell wall biosynthesis